MVREWVLFQIVLKKYNGDIRYYEKDNYLYVSAIIHSNRISN